MVKPSSEPVSRTPARTGTVGLVGRMRATHATASAKSSRTRRNFKSVSPTVVVATSIASLRPNPDHTLFEQIPDDRWSCRKPTVERSARTLKLIDATKERAPEGSGESCSQAPSSKGKTREIDEY